MILHLLPELHPRPPVVRRLAAPATMLPHLKPSPRCAILLALVLVLLALPATAQSFAQSPGPLLWLQDHHRTASGAWNDDILIFRDGEVVVHRVFLDGTSTVLRGHDSGFGLAELGRALAVEQVGLWGSGVCRLELVLPDVSGGPAALPAQRSVVLSWFGRNGRRSSHLSMVTVGGERCTGAQERLTVAALTFATDALAVATPTTGPGSDPAKSLLFDIHNQVLGDSTCDPYTFVDRMLLFRDGLFVRLYIDTDGEFIVVRADLGRENLAPLASTLQDHQVATLDGDCYLWFLLPFFVQVDCQEFSWSSWATWFGRGQRRATLFGAGEITNQCSTDQQAVRDALMKIVSQAVASRQRSEVRGSLPGFGT